MVPLASVEVAYPPKTDAKQRGLFTMLDLGWMDGAETAPLPPKTYLLSVRFARKPAISRFQ